MEPQEGQPQQPVEEVYGLFQDEAPEPQAQQEVEAPAKAPAPAPQAEEEKAVATSAPPEKSWTQLAAREAKLREQERSIRELAKQVESLKSLPEKLKSDPISALTDMGIDLLASLEKTPEAPQVRELSELRAKVAEMEKARQAEEQRRNAEVAQQSYAQLGQHIHAEIQKASDKYPHLNVAIEDAPREIIRAIEIEYKNTGEYPPLEDVLLRAESVYAEMIEKAIEKAWPLIEKHPRLKSKADPPQQKPAVTLGSQVAGETAPRGTRPLTDEERDEEAMKIFREMFGQKEDTA